MGIIDNMREMKGNNSPATTGVDECEKIISELEVKKNEVIMDIGKQFVERNDPESVKGTEYEESIKRVMEIDEQMEAQLTKKLALHGMRKCNECGNILVIDSLFCNKCGTKLEPIEMIAPNVRNTCPSCGASLEEGTIFCTSCGRKIE